MIKRSLDLVLIEQNSNGQNGIEVAYVMRGKRHSEQYHANVELFLMEYLALPSLRPLKSCKVKGG